MRVGNAILALLFAAAAVLQYNDPDPLRWAALYGAAALACLVHRRHRLAVIAPAVAGAAALIWAGILAPEALDSVTAADLFRSMDDKGGSAELARELVGLLMVALWMVILVITARPRGRRSPD